MSAGILDYQTPGLDSGGVTDKPTWRDRVLAEEELLEQLRVQASETAQRRAAALVDGVKELGSVYAVAKALGRSHTAIAKAIKKHGAPNPSTTE